MLKPLPGAPPAVAAALNRLTDELERAAGQNFGSLILYGGLARGRYRPGKSDVNVLVLLHDASAQALAAIAPALQAAWRAAGVEPMLLTLAEVPRAADAFPTKFIDIKNHHVVLAGADPLSSLEVPREHLRRRVEQELRNMLLRLRHRYVASGSDSAILARVLTDMARPLALELAALLRLAGKPVPDDDRSAVIFDAAASAFGLKHEALQWLAELRQNPLLVSDLPGLCADVLEALARTAGIAAEMKEASA